MSKKHRNEANETAAEEHAAATSVGQAEACGESEVALQPASEGSVESPPVVEAESPALAVPAGDSAPLPLPNFRVSLNAATPIASPSLDVYAPTGAAEEARAIFNAANGISGSDHPYTIETLAAK